MNHGVFPTLGSYTLVYSHSYNLNDTFDSRCDIMVLKKSQIKKKVGPEIYVIELIFKLNFKTLFFLMLGVPSTFPK